MGDAKIV
jgi:hypothetical protein